MPVSNEELSCTHRLQLRLVTFMSHGVVHWMTTTHVINDATDTPYISVGTNATKRFLIAKDL